MPFDWKKLTPLLEDLLALAPDIITSVEQDKADASTETKTQLAAQTLVQTSTVAQAIDPNEAGAIEGVTALASGVITALKTPPPVAPPAA